MAEFLSFILFIALLSGSLYLTFVLILPVLVIYLGGVTMALLAATYLVRQDKHRARFASIPVSRRVLRQVSLLAIALPVVHAALMWPIRDTGWVIWVLSVNMVLSLLWLVVFLVGSRRAARIYKHEKGEIRSLLGNVVARKEALNIKADSLRCLLDEPQGLEPWEALVLGDEIADQVVDRKKIKDLLVQISTMAGRFDEFVTEYDELVRQCKEDNSDSCKTCEQIKSVLKQTEPSYKGVIETSGELISQYED